MAPKHVSFPKVLKVWFWGHGVSATMALIGIGVISCILHFVKRGLPKSLRYLGFEANMSFVRAGLLIANDVCYYASATDKASLAHRYTYCEIVTSYHSQNYSFVWSHCVLRWAKISPSRENLWTGRQDKMAQKPPPVSSKSTLLT